MIRRLARCIREYWWAALLSPLCMIGEVAMEVTIPLVMKELYDHGVALQNMQVDVGEYHGLEDTLRIIEECTQRYFTTNQ